METAQEWVALQEGETVEDSRDAGSEQAGETSHWALLTELGVRPSLWWSHGLLTVENKVLRAGSAQQTLTGRHCGHQ